MVRIEDKAIVGDVTERAEFFSASNPKVAIVNENGILQAVGDGETNISASQDDMRATIKVKVEKTRGPHPVSFTNHVMPILTKLGCNSQRVPRWRARRQRRLQAEACAATMSGSRSLYVLTRQGQRAAASPVRNRRVV